MTYQTRTDPPEPIEAVQFVHQPMVGFERQSIGTDAEGKIIYEAISDAITVHSGDWLVAGQWLSPEAFDALYEKVPEPEPIPEPEPVVESEVEPIVEEAPIAHSDPPAAGDQDHAQDEAAVAPEATVEEVTTHEGE